MRRGPLLLVAALLLGADGRAPAEAELFSGFLVPASATDLYAPESGFRVSGWTSWGSPLKLTELVPDGTAVKEGQVIARFEFRGTDARSRLQEWLRAALADAAKSHLWQEQGLESLRVERRRKELEAKLATLQLERERVVSARQAELDRIAKRIADFEVEAVKQRLTAAHRTAAAERAYHEQAVRRARNNLEVLAFYERRTVLRAPHEGVVRHAFNAQERRKVQKGDALQSGVKVVSVARDASLAVRFFVPEHRLEEVAAEAGVLAVTVGAGEELRAVVKQVDFFPQELGMLLENAALPNAREKAFAVMAALEGGGAPARLTAGTEVRARVTGPPPKQTAADRTAEDRP